MSFKKLIKSKFYMTLEQILALLTARFAGVRKDGLAQMAKSILLNVTNEEEAQAQVDRLNETQVTDFVKEWRAEVDREVASGIETYKKKNPAKKEGEGDPEPPTPPNPPADPTDIAAIVAQAVAAQLKPLQEEIGNYKKADVSKNRRAALEDKLKEAPEKFKSKILKDYDRMNFDTEETFTEYLTETEADLTDFTQDLANQGLGRFPRPVQISQGKPSEVPADVAGFIKSQAPESATNLGGKEV